MNSTTAIKKVIVAEGGPKYTNNPKDSGGPTKYGITLKTLSSHRGYQCTAEDVKNLTEAEAIAIYKKNYWDAIKGDSIHSFNIAYALFNMAVNRGVGAAVKTAQKVLGVAVDGGLGAMTLTSLNLANEKTFLSKFLAQAEIEYKALVAARPKDEIFLKGWLNRVSEISDFVGVKPAQAAAISGALVIAIVGFFLIINSSKRA